MNIAIIGRGEYLYEVANFLYDNGYKIKLVITAKEAPEYKITSEDYKVFAKKIGAEYLFTSKLNSNEHNNLIKKCAPFDCAISINYSSIITKEVIGLFGLGILNFHCGDLPKYRGNAPIAWAIINRENRIGLCVHKMEGGSLDSGDIIARDYLDINLNTKIGEIHNYCLSRVSGLMFEAIKKLENNPDYIMEKQSKEPKKALRGYPRMPEDGKIDWNKSSEDILRLINASSEPYSGAFCEYDGGKLIIWDAELFEDTENYLAVSGQISSIADSGDVLVITGDGKLRIKEVEFNGNRGKLSTIISSIRKRLK